MLRKTLSLESCRGRLCHLWHVPEAPNRSIAAEHCVPLMPSGTFTICLDVCACVVLWERNVVDVASPHLMSCDEGVSELLLSWDNIWMRRLGKIHGT